MIPSKNVDRIGNSSHDDTDAQRLSAVPLQERLLSQDRRTCSSLDESSTDTAFAIVNRSQATEMVLDVLKWRRANGDVCTSDDILRRILMRRWPAACASSSLAAGLWIRTAVSSGSVTRFFNPTTKKYYLCLPTDLSTAVVCQSAIDTTRESSYVVELLRDCNGFISRTALTDLLMKTYPSMQEPWMRRKLYVNAAAGGHFFVAQKEGAHAVGLTQETAEYALGIKPVEIKPVRKQPVHEGKQVRPQTPHVNSDEQPDKKGKPAPLPKLGCPASTNHVHHPTDSDGSAVKESKTTQNNAQNRNNGRKVQKNSEEVINGSPATSGNQENASIENSETTSIKTEENRNNGRKNVQEMSKENTNGSATSSINKKNESDGRTSPVLGKLCRHQ